jgi:TonB family protein
MKTFVFRLTATVMLVLLFPLTLSLAQKDEKPVGASSDVSAFKAVEAPTELANQEIDFVASEFLVLNEFKPVKKLSFRDRNTFKNVETFPVPENGVELGSVVQGLITYPQTAIDQGIEGVVRVLCMIAKDGSVSSVVVLNDIGGNCAEEVCKAVKTIKFKPAMQNGYPRRCNLVIPVFFDLTDYR